MTITRTFVFTSGGPTYVSESNSHADVVAAVDAGIMFDFTDINGSTVHINPSTVVSVMEREDPT